MYTFNMADKLEGSVPSVPLRRDRPVDLSESIAPDEPSEPEASKTSARTEAVESRTSSEGIRPSIDIADRNLPGNYGWTGRLINAAENKWLSFRTWDKTHGDRAISARKARTADVLGTKIDSLRGERETCAEYLSKMRDRIGDIKDNDSWFSQTTLGRGINNARMRWTSIKAGWWERSVKDLDAQLKAVGSRHQKALDTKSFHDARINDEIGRAEKRLNDKLAPIERLRAEVDASAEKYGRSVTNYDQVRTKILEQIDALKGQRRRGGMTDTEFTAQQEALSKLRENLRKTNRIIEQHQKKYLRCIDHQKRLANAHGDSRATRESITGRMYRSAARVSTPESGVRSEPPAETAETEPPVRAEILRAHLEDGESTEVSIEQFHSLWNLALPGAEMKKGRRIENPRDLFKLWDLAFPESTSAPITITPEQRENGFKTVGEWRKFVEALYKVDDGFKAFVRGETRDAEEAMDRISLFAANKLFV